MIAHTCFDLKLYLTPRQNNLLSSTTRPSTGTARSWLLFTYGSFPTKRIRGGSKGFKRTDMPFQRNNSMLTFEKEPFQGTQSILEKLTVSRFVARVAYHEESMWY